MLFSFSKCQFSIFSLLLFALQCLNWIGIIYFVQGLLLFEGRLIWLEHLDIIRRTTVLLITVFCFSFACLVLFYSLGSPALESSTNTIFLNPHNYQFSFSVPSFQIKKLKIRERKDISQSFIECKMQKQIQNQFCLTYNHGAFITWTVSLLLTWSFHFRGKLSSIDKVICFDVRANYWETTMTKTKVKSSFLI